MEKKKCLSVCMILVLALMLTACKGGQKDNDLQTSNLNVSSPGSYPIVKDKITLKFVIPQPPSIMDYSTNEFSKYLEEKTNVHIDWQTVPSENVAEKVNIILASGSYPDAFIGVRLISPAQEAQYGMDEKVFIPLNNLIDKYGYNIKKVFDYLPEAKGIVTNPDGNIYSLPTLSDCFHCQFPQKLWINTDWLKKLGLKTPTTTEEFYQVLKAFRDKDPNGNGKKDEIPMIGGGTWYGNVEGFLLNSFLYYDSQNPFIVNKGKIEETANKDSYKEGLKWLNKLYKEKLIYESSFTQTGEQMQQLIENPGASIVGAATGGASLFFAKAGGERYKQLEVLSPLKGPNGVQYAVNYPYESVWTGMFSITNACKHPEVAFMYADLMYSEDATMRLRQGVPGKEWDKAPTGDMGINGKQATWKRLTPWDTSTPQNETWFDQGPFFETADMRLGQAFSSNVDMFSADGVEKLLYEMTKQHMAPFKPSEPLTVPPVKFTKAENDEILTIQTEVKKYITESMTKFVSGELDIDKEWDKYVKTLNTIGYDKWASAYQKAYDRQYKK